MEAEAHKRYSYGMFVRDFWNLLGRGKARFIIASLLRVTGDISWLYPPVAFATIINFFTSWNRGDSLDPVFFQAGLWIAAIAVRHVSNYLAKSIAWRVSERAALDAQVKGEAHLFRLDMAWHEKENAGNKLKRIERGGYSIDKVARIWMGNLLEIIVNVTAILVIMATIDPLLTLGFGFFIVTFTVIASLLMRPASKATREVNAKEENLNGLFFEGLNNIRSTKVLGMTAALLKIMNVSADELYAKIRARISAFQFRALVIGLYGNTFKVCGLLFIVYGISRGHFEVGLLVLFNGYVNRIAESLTELSDVSQDLVAAKYGIERYMYIVNTPVQGEEKGKVAFPKNWKQLTLENVSFSYGEHPVLQDISLTIERGEKIGVVGLSGAGKSTLFKLLLKENESYSGKILVDAVPLRDIKRSSYYEKAAVVLQDTEVFNFSLKENVTLAHKTRAKDSAALSRALEIAHVTDYVDRLPDGVETMIGEKGIKLSGGERQRLGIARAVFKEPEILFLDEATSHLDLQSEEKIQDSLHTFFKSVTAIVIAHRLTTIREMDRILLLEEGKILEDGSFEELYAKKGRFFELWEKQRLS